MTPQDHLAIAEGLIAGHPGIDDPSWLEIDLNMAVTALAHAVIALAAEVGVPHATQAPTAASGG